MVTAYIFPNNFDKSIVVDAREYWGNYKRENILLTLKSKTLNVEWDKDEIIFYQDTFGNWYDNKLCNYPCPYKCIKVEFITNEELSLDRRYTMGNVDMRIEDYEFFSESLDKVYHSQDGKRFGMILVEDGKPTLVSNDMYIGNITKDGDCGMIWLSLCNPLKRSLI